MSFRITNNATKVGYVVTCYLVALLVALGVAVTAGAPTAAAVWGILLIASVVIAARGFRGENEAVEAPRAWWRMTARSTSGFVFAALFLLQGVSLVVSSMVGASAVAVSYLVVGVINLVFAAAFAHSSLRLRSVQMNNAPAAESLRG